MSAIIVSPLLWIILLIGLSIVLKNPKRKKQSKHTGFILLLIFTNGWLSDLPLHFWEYRTIEVMDIKETYEIAIILGPFVYYNEELPNHETIIGNETPRLTQAIELYNQKKFKKFLLSGNDDANQTQLHLLRLGIPANDILVEDKSNNTYENALFSKHFLEQRGDLSNSLLLITSASHMRRAKKCFDKIGLNVTPFSIGHWASCSEVWKFSLDDIIPSHVSIRKWKILFHEWGSTILFKMKGYI